MPKDFRVEMIAYNNHILTKMEQAGFVYGGRPSMSLLTLAMGYERNPTAQKKVRDLICLQQSPTKADGSWLTLVVELATILKCRPKDLYPGKLKQKIPQYRSRFSLADFGEPVSWIVM